MNTTKQLRLRLIPFIGYVTVLFSLGMIRFAEVHAQPSLLEATTININGEAWTFRTPPPPESQRQVIPTHPRLFITQDSLPGLQQKLADPIYANDIVALKNIADGRVNVTNPPLANALLYLLEGDESRGNAAKDWLLSGTFGDVPGLERAAEWVEPILVFDWVYPLLSSSEKTTAFNRLKSNFGYDHRTDTPPREGETLYWNDVYARQPEIQYPILALAIAGDGIDDAWAEEVLDLAYNESPLVMGPYGPEKGAGFLDILASISLDDGGGEQVGGDGNFGTGYYNMFLNSFMPMAAWETATGQSMWARSPFFSKLPSYWAYDKSKVPGD